MNDVAVTTALQLHAFGLSMLQDPNWTGMELYDRLKQHVRGRKQPVDLLFKPLERGLPYYLGGWLFDDFFDTYRISQLEPEYRAWFLSDFVDFLAHHKIDPAPSILSNARRLLNDISRRYERDEIEYFGYLHSRSGRDRLRRWHLRLTDATADEVTALRPLYSENYSDRVFHDRQLCAYIAELLVTIGFDGDLSDKDTRSQWVDRPDHWPARIKRMLLARDRGRCALCSTDLVQELLEEIHVDHIVPLARGGCNDIVNLQVLCLPCNLKKGTSNVTVRASMPKYIKPQGPR